VTAMWLSIGIFAAAAALVGVVGPRLSRAADAVGRLTGMGSTLAGALLLGATTSLPGLIVSLRAALRGEADVALSNSIGGIAAQTLFIAIADIALRSGQLTARNTLAASLLQSALLVCLLTLVLIAMAAAPLAWLGVHPLSVVMAVGLLVGFAAIRRERRTPGWRVPDPPGRDDSPAKSVHADGDGAEHRSNRSIVGEYLVCVALVAAAGWGLSWAGGRIIRDTGWSPVTVGMTLLAVSTSLPELVTAVAAVRRKAVGLAIGNIVGGNAFDTIMIALSDLAYREGSIYRHAAVQAQVLAGVALLMTGLLMAGLIRREQQGLASIGVESWLIMAVYAAGVVAIMTGVV